MNWKTMNEKELREATAPTPQTEQELADLVRTLAEREHEYGTCVYAMSIAATAAFNYIANKLGVTGFQASCADLDIVRRTRRLTHGFRIVNYENLLYPQYEGDLTVTPAKLLKDPELRKRIAEEARKKLEENDEPHPNVKAHWQKLAAMVKS